MKGGKKGTLMVESALILPVVMLGLLAVLYILLFLYSQAAVQAAAHMEARAGAGLAAGTVSREETDLEKGGLYFRGEHRRQEAEATEDRLRETLGNASLNMGVLEVEAFYEPRLLRSRLHLTAETEKGPWGLLRKGGGGRVETWAGLPGEAELLRKAELFTEGLATWQELTDGEEK
ncbi:MAG: pilus assembly protein [Bacillota bacterium]|nr:pilus assembly protein [Bacillota bacterium]